MIADRSDMPPAGPLVFLVDDDDAVRDSLQLALEAEGFAVATFSSGQAALASLAQTRPACMVLDVNMPTLGGPAIVDALAARHIRVPVVMITGDIRRGTQQRALQGGADAVLQKPVTGAELAAAIRQTQPA